MTRSRTNGLLRPRLLHGDDDPIVPSADSAMLSSKLIRDAQLKLYKGAPHGIRSTHKDQVNADLLAFCRDWSIARFSLLAALLREELPQAAGVADSVSP